MRPEPAAPRAGRPFRPVPGIVVSIVDYPPGYRMARHDHDYANISLLLGGALRERVGVGRHEGSGGHLVYKPTGTPHEDEIGPDGARAFRVSLHDGAALPFLGAGRVEAYRWERGGPALPLMLRACGEYRRRDRPSSTSLECIALELLDLARPDPGAGSPAAAGADSRGSAPAWLRGVLDEIHARFDETIRVGDLAASAGVHPVYLARVFRRRFRLTIGEYARWIRLARAVERMQDRRAALADIALEAGFFDQAHFSRVFRDSIGESPSAFRRLAAAH